jgi:lipoprotein-anchoring transpeptidase ErfK/SrfK
MMLPLVLSLAAAISLGSPQQGQPAAPHPGAASKTARDDSAKPVSDAVAVQVMLDRADFSPGVIDGRSGGNTAKALAAYEKNGGDPAALPLQPTTEYTITADDAAGPFTPDIPAEIPDQANLQALGYRTPLEMLAERFHSTPELLKRLNPNAGFTEGETITVPNVVPFVAPVEKLPGKPPSSAGTTPTATSGRAESKAADAPAKPETVTVTVSKGLSALTVTDANGKMLFYAPVTTGSEHDPLPIGEWKVTGVQLNPAFHYNPALFWDADPSHTKVTVAPGPNNPVGFVWIDLSKEHYGIHGTPEPSRIGHVESHGCVRMTNWDAVHVASLVKPGTRVVFEE